MTNLIRYVTTPRIDAVLTRMEEKGYPTVAALCKDSGISSSAIGRIINLDESPYDHRTTRYGANNLTWKPCVLAICATLRSKPEDLFHPNVVRIRRDRSVRGYFKAAVNDKGKLRLIQEPVPRGSIVKMIAGK